MPFVASYAISSLSVLSSCGFFLRSVALCLRSGFEHKCSTLSLLLAEMIDLASTSVPPVVINIANERASRRAIEPVSDKNKSSYLWKMIGLLVHGPLLNADKSQWGLVCKLCYDAKFM